MLDREPSLGERRIPIGNRTGVHVFSFEHVATGSGVFAGSCRQIWSHRALIWSLCQPQRKIRRHILASFVTERRSRALEVLAFTKRMPAIVGTKTRM